MKLGKILPTYFSGSLKTLNMLPQNESILMKRHYFLLFSIIIVLAERVWNIAINIQAALMPSQTPIPADGLPIAPELAFGWMQVVANMGMSVILIWAIWLLWRAVRQATGLGKPEFSGSHILAILLLLAFCLPAWWHGFWAILNLFQGRILIDWRSPFLVLVWLAQMGLIFLPITIWRIYRRKPTPAPMLPETPIIDAPESSHHE